LRNRLGHLADDRAGVPVAHQDKVRQVPVEDEIHDRLGRFGVGDVLGDILPVAGYRWGESGVAESLQVFDNRAPRRAVVTSAVHQDEGVRTGHPGFRIMRFH